MPIWAGLLAVVLQDHSPEALTIMLEETAASTLMTEANTDTQICPRPQLCRSRREGTERFAGVPLRGTGLCCDAKRRPHEADGEMSERGPWPKSELVSIGGPNMPKAERVTRYRANVMAIHEAGHAVRQ